MLCLSGFELYPRWVPLFFSKIVRKQHPILPHLYPFVFLLLRDAQLVFVATISAAISLRLAMI